MAVPATPVSDAPAPATAATGLVARCISQAKDVAVQRKLVAELLGTSVLVFTVGSNALNPSPFGAFSVGASLAVMVYSLGPISGANLNPAVSTALLLAQKLELPLFLLYVTVQLIAGVVSCLCFSLLFADGASIGPSETTNWASVLAVEFLYTFMLCFVVLSTACRSESNQYFGLAIGGVIFAGGSAAGWISGGALNPAVALALDASSLSTSGFGACFAYAIAQCLGGAASAFAFKTLNPSVYGGTVEEGSRQHLKLRLAAESLGTFFLCLTVGLSVLQEGGNQNAAFAIASCLMVMIYATGHISGGHLNPAVTVAFVATERNIISHREAGWYVAAQSVGGLTAAFVYAAVGGAFELGPHQGFSWVGVVAAELVWTFVLCYVVLAVTTYSKDMFGLAIGWVLISGGYAVGSVSGAAFNPAVALAVDTSWGVLNGSWWKCLVYTFIQCLGGVGAALVFRVTHAEVDHPGEREGSYRKEELNEPASGA